MYYSDRPITTTREDLLFREHFTQVLADTICSIDNHDTYTIGVYGKWGCGKTSIVNMAIDIVKHKKNRQITVIPFEAWNCMSEEQLLSQFFARLASELTGSKDKAISKIGTMISDYAGIYDLIELAPKVGRVASIIAKMTGNRIASKGHSFANADLYTQKERITEELKKINKRFLIVIDDIDRLNDKQIRLLFQLVKEVANFPNITYLLIYDRDIVVKALEEIQKGYGKDYLEKIVQMPIGVPETPKERLEEILELRLQEMIKKYNARYDKMRLWDIKHWIYSLNSNSIREINRLCNALECKLSLLRDSVDFYDLVLLTIIELKYYKLYCWIKNNKNLLVDIAYIGGRIKELPSSPKSRKECVELFQSLCDTTDEKEIDNILDLVRNLFPAFNRFLSEYSTQLNSDYYLIINSVCCISRFDRYFQCSMENELIDYADVDQFMQADDLVCIEYYFEKYCRYESRILFLREVKARIVAGDIIDPMHLFVLMINYSGKAKSGDGGRFGEVLIDSIVESLLLSVPQEEQLTTMLDAIEMSESDSVSDIIEFVKQVLEEKGGQKESQRVVGIDSHGKGMIYQALTQRIRELLKEKAIFDFRDFERVESYLIENGDKGILMEHHDAMRSDARFRLWEYAKRLSAGGCEETVYSIDPALRTTKHNISEAKEAIIACLQNREFFTFDIATQHKACALWLMLDDKRDINESVSDKDDVIPKLKEWKEKYEPVA